MSGPAVADAIARVQDNDPEGEAQLQARILLFVLVPFIIITVLWVYGF